MPNYIASGGLRLKGCAVVSVAYNYAVKFLNNEAAFICAKAAIGKIEKIYIKSVFVNDPLGSSCYIVYKDYNNRLWLEKELCTAEQAAALATAYLENYIAKLQDEECIA